MANRFPRKSVVWSGAILDGIVHAARGGTTSGCWKCNHYLTNGEDGREGAITFAGGHWYADAPLIGVFYNAHSPRRASEEEALERYFRGCTPYQRDLADQFALPYLQLDHNGRLLHRVTTAFWDEGDYVTAVDPWDEVLKNGADLLKDAFIEDR